MPSGKTHDKITFYSAVPVFVGSWLLTRRLDLCFFVTGGFVFAGLMFSGDLDVKSVQYKRWGWLRWIWIPYQRLISHRSPLSHGPVLGTVTRLVYLSVWLLLLFLALQQLAHLGQQEALTEQSQFFLRQLARQLLQQPEWGAALLISLWLGALSHTLADELGSRWKKWRKAKNAGSKPNSKAKARQKSPQKKMRVQQKGKKRA